MRGAGPASHGGVGEKWLSINQVVRDAKIAILGLQEAHLPEARVEQLNDLFQSTMKVYASEDPENPTGARGVAIAINKRLVDIDGVVAKVIIPGRALEVKVRWTKDKSIRILAIYAPNEHNANADFWERLSAAGISHPNILIGDFNIVEAPIDRYPARADPEKPVEALRAMYKRWNMRDEWRETHPGEIQYTYLQTATHSQSRIDRIYLDEWMRRNATEWTTGGPGIPTDHQMVTCTLANREKPFIGKGRWQMHQMLLDDKTFLKTVKSKGIELRTQIAAIRMRTDENNPQKLYARFKEEVRLLARDMAKANVPKISKTLDKLKNDVNDVNKLAADTTKSEEDRKAAAQEAALLQDRIAELEVKRFGAKRAAVAARDWLEGETVSKYWMRLNKTTSADETIYELTRHENGITSPKMRSDRMAEIAMNHYNKVQDDESKPNPGTHEVAIEAVLDESMPRLSGTQKRKMAEEIECLEVQNAIREAARGKAPGMDGLPTELWKNLLEMHIADSKKKRPEFNVAAMLRD
ncbi:DNase I-like protein, partial [Polyporus arcularius HHB13444]